MLIIHKKQNINKTVHYYFFPGNRGKNYAMYAKQFPHLFEVVGVAEPRQYARQVFKSNYNLPFNRSVKQLLYLP